MHPSLRREEITAVVVTTRSHPATIALNPQLVSGAGNHRVCDYGCRQTDKVQIEARHEPQKTKLEDEPRLTSTLPMSESKPSWYLNRSCATREHPVSPLAVLLTEVDEGEVERTTAADSANGQGEEAASVAPIIAPSGHSYEEAWKAGALFSRRR